VESTERMTQGLERLRGKSVVVTGAGAGIGRAIALRMADEGARVAIADMNEESANKVYAELEGDSLVQRADVTKAEEVEALVRRVAEEWGGLDVMVNNAGVGIAATTPETTEEDWDRVLAVCLKGTFFGMKYAIPAIRDSGGGSVINI
jgi:NAD(P)-dependent dehydrogenase (short-subunit alcohol dehydrogenase family)